MKTNYKSRAFWGLMLGLSISFGCSKEEDLEDLQLIELDQISAKATTMDGSVNPLVKLKGNHYIILTANNSLPTDLKGQIQSMKGEVTGLMEEIGIATVTSTDPNFARKAARINGVSSVVRDVEIQWFNPRERKLIAFDEASYDNPPNSGNDDPFFDLQWGHDAVNAPEAWNAGARGKGVRVAVLDTGFDLDHADLEPNIDFGASASFVPGETLQYTLPDPFSHGTHTAGTIAAADNGIGIIGVAPEAELILVKVLGDEGSGAFSWIIQGIHHAVQQGADVINMSLGAYLPRNGKYLDDNGTPDDPSDDFPVHDAKAIQEQITALNKATTYATQQGVTVIASAGNSANNGNKDKSWMHIPSASPNVISISATAPQGWALSPLTAHLDFLASYSNYGTPDVDFAAPGGDIMFAYSELGLKAVTVGGLTQPAYVFDLVFSAGSNPEPGVSSYYWSAGTSMAAPHAAGVAALIIGQNGGDMKPTQVEAALRASADDLGKPGRDPYYGHGRVNAYKAISAVVQ